MNQFKINHAAALLFWLRADSIGIGKAIEQFEDQGAASFVDVPYFRDVLLSCDINPPGEHSGLLRFMSKQRGSDVRSLIAAEIDSYLCSNRQLTGPLYLDEISTGRSMEAAGLDVASVCALAVNAVIDGDIPCLGMLCLRHPLPAVLVASEPVLHDFVRVKSTQAALGREYPMFLAVQGCMEVDPGVYVISGVFQIPVADLQHGQAWAGVIQNSSRFVNEFRIVGPADVDGARIVVTTGSTH